MTDSDNSIKVEIQARSIDFVTIFAGVVFVSPLILIGIPLMSSLSIGNQNDMSFLLLSDIPFYLFMLAFFAFGVGALIFRLTLQETITINRDAITTDYQTLVFKKRSYQYLAKDIQGLRSSPLPSSNFFWSNRIAFDYGGKTYYVGNGLTESEAQHILSAVKTKFENYGFAK